MDRFSKEENIAFKSRDGHTLLNTAFALLQFTPLTRHIGVLSGIFQRIFFSGIYRLRRSHFPELVAPDRWLRSNHLGKEAISKRKEKPLH